MPRFHSDNHNDDDDDEFVPIYKKHKIVDKLEEQRKPSLAGRKREPNSLRTRLTNAKKALNRGEAYTTVDGKQMPERKMGPACKSTCRWLCSKRFDDTERKKLFDNFWSLADRELQWQFIAEKVPMLPKDRATTAHRIVRSRRENSRYYHFEVNGLLERVCKTMFINTFGISNQWLITVNKKLKRYGCVNGDGRGKIGHRRKNENK